MIYKDDDLMSHVRLARRRSGMQCGKDHRKVQSDVIHWQHGGEETGHQTLGLWWRDWLPETNHQPLKTKNDTVILHGMGISWEYHGNFPGNMGKQLFFWIDLSNT
jgi:hypothetical protein